MALPSWRVEIHKMGRPGLQEPIRLRAETGAKAQELKEGLRKLFEAGGLRIEGQPSEEESTIRFRDGESVVTIVIVQE